MFIVTAKWRNIELVSRGRSRQTTQQGYKFFWRIFADLNNPLSPKVADKHALTKMNLTSLGLSRLSFFYSRTYFKWIIKQLLLLFVLFIYLSLSLFLQQMHWAIPLNHWRSVTNTQSDKESDISTRKIANLDGQIALKTVRRNTLKFQVSALFLHSS